MSKFTQYLKRANKAALATLGLLSLSFASQAQYCIPMSFSDCSDGDQINTFILNGANSTSINDPSTGCAADGYDDKTGLAPVSLAQGVAYSATVSSEYDEDYCAIWIDFDNSESFEPGELVAAHSSFISPTGSNVAINIPLNAALGVHRMRVMVAFPYIDWFDPTPADEFDPCNESPEWGYGEVHDYMINILPAPSCAPPSNIIVNNLSSSSVQVEWTGTGSFALEYGPQGFTPGANAGAGAQGTVISPVTSPQTIENLALLTTYDVYVRKDCGAEGYSNNSLVVSFQVISDECSDAIAIPSSGSLSTSNNGATESMDPITCEGFISSLALDVWYTFTPEETGDITLDIDEWDIDATVEVFSGDCENPQSIACADMQFPLTFPVTADETYFFRVYGWDGEEGEFNISLTGVPLPVSASDLKGKIVNKVPQLSWVTYSERNNQGFEVQRANDGKSFTTVGYVSSKSNNGSSNSITSYEFQDRTYIAGEAYYRYVQKDIDGKTAVSNIVRLEQGKENGFTISAYPNPATGKVSIATKGVRAANSLITLTDALGKTVHTWPVSADLLHVDLSELPAGIYLLKYTDDLNNQVIKLSKQ